MLHSSTPSRDNNERWLPIPDWEGLYEVSDMGHVRSVDRWVYAHYGPVGNYEGRFRRGKTLKATVDSKGYPYVTLCRGQEDRQRIGVHALVMRAFVGPRPDGMEVRHLDGNSSDPKLLNLAYGTRSENAQDALRHGTNHQAKKTHCKFGHPLSGDNLYVWSGRKRSGTWRQCRKCRANAHARRKQRQRRIGGAGAAAAVSALLLALPFSAPARADAVTDYVEVNAPVVCHVLDEFPTFDGISGIGLGIMDDGLTATQAGGVITLAVHDVCPRHTTLLLAFIEHYSGGTVKR